jgi:hypothetical protein
MLSFFVVFVVVVVVVVFVVIVIVFVIVVVFVVVVVVVVVAVVVVVVFVVGVPVKRIFMPSAYFIQFLIIFVAENFYLSAVNRDYTLGVG